MARTREFDPKDVIEKAVYLFWEKGYSDTSMDDLVKHTGVSRYGIYGEFGNKREFFITALEHFHNKFVEEIVQDLVNPESGLAELRAYFGRLLGKAQTQEARLGCFMCNTAVELSVRDHYFREHVNSMFEALRGLFLNALNNARAHGELDDSIEPEEYSSYLVGVQQGVSTMVRSGFDHAHMQQFIKVALAALN